MDDRKLRKMISSWLDGIISQEEKGVLEQTLREDAHARHVYLQYMNTHAELCNSATAQDYLQSINGLGPVYSEQSESYRHQKSSTSRMWGVFALAASLVAVVGTWQGFELWKHLPDQAAVEARILKEVTPLSDKSTWYVEHSRRENANSFRSGDVIRLTNGKLELKYTHGTTVVLHSPAAYQLVTDMKARVLLGRLTATVPEAGIGFSVLTPRATVIDLGTEFGVEVNEDGATDVVVFNGEVDVDYHDQTDQQSARRLRMGEALHLDAVGTASRIVSINGQSYSNKALESLSRPVVITEVLDNIERNPLMLNFYQIVPNGLEEDSLAYVDRLAHEWNGIDSKGMPPYLLGADYVKTFNRDKFKRNISISVKLDSPCNLYILFDNRLPVPEWLLQDFRDTGDDIGMDTGPFHTSKKGWVNTESAGVGPGVSVENTLSIWVKKVSKPGIVLLGSTVTPQALSNMYGIAAVPLDSPLSDCPVP